MEEQPFSNYTNVAERGKNKPLSPLHSFALSFFLSLARYSFPSNETYIYICTLAFESIDSESFQFAMELNFIILSILFVSDVGAVN